MTCNSCNERCPQEVNPYEVLVRLKNHAVKNKMVEGMTTSYEQVKKTGYSLPITDRTNRAREELGLKPMKENKKLRKILK